MRRFPLALALVLATGLLAACAVAPTTPATSPASLAALDAAIAGDWRGATGSAFHQSPATLARASPCAKAHRSRSLGLCSPTYSQ